jgi:hypothetical protein
MCFKKGQSWAGQNLQWTEGFSTLKSFLEWTSNLVPLGSKTSFTELYRKTLKSTNSHMFAVLSHFCLIAVSKNLTLEFCDWVDELTNWMEKTFMADWSGMMAILPIDYRCEDGRFTASVSCVTNSNPDLQLALGDTGVNSGRRSWNIHSSEWAWCQWDIGVTYFTKKQRAATLRPPGLEIDSFKPLLKSGMFYFIFWLNGTVVGVTIGFCIRGSQDLPDSTNGFS